MLKKLLLLFVFITSVSNAQHTIKGAMSPEIATDWLILYRLEGTKQVFVNNTTIQKDSIAISGVKQAVSSFTITLPASAKPGTYRATYKLEGAGFIDFVYNKEDISFIFNPEYPKQSAAFLTSKENKLYGNYLTDIAVVQQKLDSIQIAALQNPSLDLKEDYKKTLEKVAAVQARYMLSSKNKYIAPFVKASARNNPSEILTSVPAYLGNIKNTYFDKLDFSNQTLINSSFLTNRILDYIFYINYTKDDVKQQELYKQSITTVLSKINNARYKSAIIEFLIEQFETTKNIAIIDYLFNEHYSKLPENLQNTQFIEEKKLLFTAEVGRIAPDFSWQEKGSSFQLSTLNDANHYVLVFWSTDCSHCLKEIPELHSYMTTKPSLKVVGFALEKDALVWETYTNSNLNGWHNVLGLQKWQNKTARTYNINATPTYFILDKNKKIIAKPNSFTDVKAFIERM